MALAKYCTHMPTILGIKESRGLGDWFSLASAKGDRSVRFRYPRLMSSSVTQLNNLAHIAQRILLLNSTQRNGGSTPSVGTLIQLWEGVENVRSGCGS